MGTSLVTIGNHKIALKNKTFEELVHEIKSKLNNTKLPDEDFLKECIETWYSGSDADDQRVLTKIKLQNEWTHFPEDDYCPFETDKRIMLNGPHGLEIDFFPNKLQFWNPYDRYWQWLGRGNKRYANKWRQYYFHVLNLFGSNCVIYLSNNGHPLHK